MAIGTGEGVPAAVSSEPTRPFATLSRTGMLRRLGRLAERTLHEYDLAVRSIRIHSFDTNLLYRVRAASGERFMLRLAYPGWRTQEDLLAEAAWLDALDEETEIGAPRVIRAANGEPVLPMSGGGVPATWHATLMSWVEGRLLAHYLTATNLERMGDLFARLHRHGKSWKPPSNFTTRRFEAYLSRGEPDTLFGDGLIQSFRAEDREAFNRARAWVEREYGALDRADLRVIHCDLWHENIKLDGERLRPFDFEDTIWGYRLHDLAMAMLDLHETVGTARFPALLAAFRGGYEKRLAWPEGNLAVLQLGRLLWKANHAGRFRPDALASMSAQYGEIFRRFEQSGKLHLPANLL